jgi:DNA adenine methylase
MVTTRRNQLTDTLTPEARPLLKWAGGKTQLLPEILTRMPESFGAYHEPFMGGGAVFFAIGPQRATVSDTNENLVNLYLHTRDSAGALSESLRLLEAEFNSLSPEEQSEYFYSQRASFNSAAGGSIKKSALTVFLNKTGFNGMYRENAKGQFNIPFAKTKKVALPSRQQLDSCRAALNKADILQTGFSSVTERAKSGDFVYFDPPYVPLTKTASFTSYQATGFSMDEHKDLATVFRRLDDSGVKVLLSNSDTPEVRELFDGFTIDTVLARRSINSKGSGRGTVAEVLVRNY